MINRTEWGSLLDYYYYYSSYPIVKIHTTTTTQIESKSATKRNPSRTKMYISLPRVLHYANFGAQEFILEVRVQTSGMTSA